MESGITAVPQNLAEIFLNLPHEGRKQVHHYLCALALEAWKHFTAAEGRITYCDSVVGMFHVVDLHLPANAFNAAFGSPDEATIAAIDYRCLEPIAALQDMDLEFPNEIQFAYYAIYNAFLKHAKHENIDDWLIANQAISSSQNEHEWKAMLETAIQTAGP